MILLINLFLAASQTLPQVFLFHELLHTEVLTSAQLQLSNEGKKKKTHDQAMNLSFCPIPYQNHI